MKTTFEPLEGRRDVLRSPNFGWDDFEAERAGLRLNPTHLHLGGG